MTRMTIAQQEDWSTLARNILEMLPQKDTATTIGLYGDLGAGKTTFVQALAGLLGIVEYVTSPTFVIMKVYDVPKTATVQTHFKKLIHIDAYRVEDVKELALLRLDALYADPHNFICIEWAGRILDLLPADRLEVKIEYDAPTGIRNIDYGQKR